MTRDSADILTKRTAHAAAMLTCLAMLSVDPGPIAAQAVEPARPARPPLEATSDLSREPRPTLSLQEARVILTERNFELHDARRAVEQAALLHDEAMAALLPSIELSFEYTLHDEQIELLFANPYRPLAPYLESVVDHDPELQHRLTDDPSLYDVDTLTEASDEQQIIQYRQAYQATLTLSQTLFNWYSFTRLDLADLSLALTEARLEQTEYELTGLLYRLYFTALTYQRFIEASRRKVELARITYERARLAYENEVGQLFQVNRAEVALSSARRDLQNALLAYELAIEALSVLLNRDTDFDVAPPPELTLPENYDSLLENALAARPDVRGLDLEVDLGQRRIDEIRARWWPVLSAYGMATLQQENLITGEDLVWAILVQASWEMYDGGLRSTQTHNRQLELARSEIRRDQGRLRVESDLRRAWIEMHAQQRLIESALAEARLARENLDLIRTAWELDAATQLEIQFAQEQLFLSELALADAETSLQAQVYELYRLAGDVR